MAFELCRLHFRETDLVGTCRMAWIVSDRRGQAGSFVLGVRMCQQEDTVKTAPDKAWGRPHPCLVSLWPR